MNGLQPGVGEIHVNQRCEGSFDGSRGAAPVVFIVDDDVSVRESLELMIASTGLQPMMFASAEEFLAHPRVCAPSCLVLDVSLPDLNGLDLQSRLATDRADMPIIFLTGHGDVPMTVQAMKAGAMDFFIKPFDDELMLDAIHRAITRSQLALGHEARTRALKERHASLSRREREVLALVVSGLLNKQIGGELGISEITVKAHRGRMMQKMKAGSLPALVKMVAKLDLASVPNPGHMTPERDRGAPEKFEFAMRDDDPSGARYYGAPHNVLRGSSAATAQ